MRALRLDLFQETVCYKKPFAMKISETYPLPPYSTVNGLLHKLLEADKYIPLGISIQGSYESIVNNYQTTYFYKSKEITTMPMNQHMLLNVNLIIHISGEEKILQQLYDKFLNLDEYVSLGRKEDLVRIDNMRFVDVEEYCIDGDGGNDYENHVINDYYMKMPIYVPKVHGKEYSGINYRLNNYYKDDRKCWNKINVIYVEEGQGVKSDTILLDDFQDAVYFNN
ncbi:CRISPR-associated protein Cas5t [Hathewaya proteolytica DSM 3090]|uniref:CRISPR-associated protein Cas5t n=1 Tax=Hathewaya proteolytica DSM 3090 TaxID=1121331 RepID=A0A1M6PQS4_9CLOT|nr:type I-B CRISPR-associated protein Cas5b [Hathewaya proteolytica]SHK10290.1 CRISPR-associated protein Cas5t [Hathewaya proteolytica DSM 3090]